MTHSSKRAEFNFILNVLLLLSLSVITGIGFLMKYTLLPGYERREVYGNGVELYFMGLDRHQWGEIHLIAGLVFLALTVLHIVLHWKTVVHVFHRFFQSKPVRLITVVLLVLLCTLIMVLPILIEPEVIKGGKDKGKRHTTKIQQVDHMAPMMNRATTMAFMYPKF